VGDYVRITNSRPLSKMKRYLVRLRPSPHSTNPCPRGDAWVSGRANTLGVSQRAAWRRHHRNRKLSSTADGGRGGGRQVDEVLRKAPVFVSGMPKERAAAFKEVTQRCKKSRIVILGFGTARQKLVLE
jgi:hypothetical protein